MYKGLMKKTKVEGRADTKHNSEIDPVSLLKIQELLVVLMNLMEWALEHDQDIASDQYKTWIAKLDEAHRYSWHRLLPYGAMFIMTILTGRRGLEGIEKIKKDMWQKTWNEEFETYQFEKFVGEAQKNQQRTDEDISKNGCIPYTVNEVGLNPGYFMELYKRLLCPRQEKLWQKPKKICKTFSLEKKDESQESPCFFENGNIGKNYVKFMLERLTAATGSPRQTNCSVRPTTVRQMRRAGYDGRSICEITNHRDPNSLIHYDGASDMNEKFEKANAILKIKPTVAKRVAATVTSSEIAEVVPLLEAIPSTSKQTSQILDEMVLSQEVTTTLTRKTSKKKLLSLDPFEDDGGIDFEAINDGSLDDLEESSKKRTEIIFDEQVDVSKPGTAPPQNSIILASAHRKRSNNDGELVSVPKKRPVMKDITNQMADFEDQNFQTNFFTDFFENQNEVTKKQQIIIAREQKLRKTKLEIEKSKLEIEKNNQKTMQDLIANVCAINQKLMEKIN